MIEKINEDTIWIDFKGKMIRIEKSKHTNNKLWVSIHEDEDSDYTQRWIVEYD